MIGMRQLFIFSIALTVLEVFYFYPLLPERMAVHFNASGIADGWGPKQQFFIFYSIVMTFMALVFWGLPFIIRHVSESLINLPNKDYWLAPERKKKTLDRLVDQLLFVGTMALILMDGILYLVIKANQSENPVMQPEWLWGLIAAFFVANVIWIVNLLQGFRRPKK
jgi:uncharacterized membrane protein